MAKKETIQIRIDENTKESIRIMAKGANMSLSEFMIAGAINLSSLLLALDDTPYEQLILHHDEYRKVFGHEEIKVMTKLFNAIPKKVGYYPETGILEVKI